VPDSVYDIHAVPAATHGRVMVRHAASPRGVLAGFHGYLESAAIQMARLESIPGAEQWTVVSVQALHRVYRGRSQDVVASWMTRQDRDLAIADNIGYAASAVQLARAATAVRVVYAGFSQGGQMAFRAAVRGDAAPAGVICVGADVPPELVADPDVRFPPVLLVRGSADAWYTQATHDAGIAALRARGTDVESFVHGGGHEWTDVVSSAIGRWLDGRSSIQDP
jgi:predicted esterase